MTKGNFSETFFPEISSAVLGVINSEKKISSLEIARMCGKAHKNVLRDIKNMERAWEKINGLKFELVEYEDAKGEFRPCYLLTKTESLYIITKYNDEARAKLVLRWEELEKKERMSILMMSAQLSNQLQALQPKVDFADAVQQQPEEMTLDHVAKVLCNLGINTGERRLADALINKGLLCRKEGYRYHPYQRDVERGWFTVREITDKRGRYSAKTLVTKDGLVEIIKRFQKPFELPQVRAIQLTFAF